MDAKQGPEGGENPQRDNRALLMERALELFAKRGYDAVGVQEIVLSAGLTKPTLYHYYASKLGLLEALLEDRGGRLRLGLDEAARYDGDVPLTLERIAFRLADFAKTEPLFYRFLLSLHFAPIESEARVAAAELLDWLHVRLTATFKQAKAQLGNMHGREALFAASFLGLLNTWIGIALNGKVKLDAPTLRAVVRQFMHGIYS